MNTSENTIPEIANVVERNVNALLDRRKEEIQKRNFKEKIVDSVTNFAGSMYAVYFHIILFGFWIVWNLGWLPFKPFDSSLIDLATLAAVEAIFLTTFVLIGQKQINAQSEKWAELDLQVSLLTQHEVTRIMHLVKAIADKMEIEEVNDSEIEALSKDTHPDKVLNVMENAAK